MEMMPVLAVIKRWTALLARMLLGWQELRRARHSLRVVEESDQLIIRQMTGGKEISRSTVPERTAVPAEINRKAQRCLVILELSAADIISRRMNVPAKARELLPGIVRNQIERLSAWRASQAAYGFDVTASADAASLDVRVLITSRAMLEQACGRLADAGLRVDRVIAGEHAGDGAAPVTLWSRLDHAPEASIARTQWAIGGFVAATIGVAAIVGLWASMSAASADDESEELTARIAVLRRQVQGSVTPQSIAALAPPERAWMLKETTPVAVIVIEALSRSLPDTAHLTELTLDGTRLRIAGSADDTPSLIGDLEKSGHLKDVHFSAPTTRGADGSSFLFHIEASIAPHPKIDGS
jgi:general secretion pathway protein L